MNEIQELNVELPKIKLWNGKRVVTFRDIDEAHQRTSGTARRNFNKNKKHFIDGVDYIVRNSYEAKNEYEIIAPNGLTLITESGYLMIVKSFTDDLSWSVQRQLVNGYFKGQEQPQTQSTKLPQKETYLLKNSKTWFQRNNWKMKLICECFDWERKYLYHKILSELSDIYNLGAIEKMYWNVNGHNPKYKMDLLDYFYPLQVTADKYIDYLLGEVEE